MSVIADLKASALAATSAPWNGGPVVPPNTVEIGVFAKDADGDLAINYRNAAEKIIAHYNSLKAYEARLIAKKAPLAAQRTAMLAALAALDV
jgi:hypothetical protein